MLSLIFYWALFLFMFFMAGHFIRLAFLVGKRGEVNKIRDWRGRAVDHAAFLKTRFVALNIVCAILLLLNGFAVLLFALQLEAWTSICALVLWMYFTALQLMIWRLRQLQRG